MNIGAIDTSRIEAMVAQLKAAAARAEGGAAVDKAMNTATPLANTPSFADALRSSLEKVNSAQINAEALGQRFALGDDKVNLSDVLIERQKAGIGLQATIQVRNKLVSAYHDIMNMPV